MVFFYENAGIHRVLTDYKDSDIWTKMEVNIFFCLGYCHKQPLLFDAIFLT